MATNDDDASGDERDPGETGLGWVAVTLDGRPISAELAGAISLLERSGKHAFVTCKGRDWVNVETAAGLLGIPVQLLQARAAAGLLPSARESESRLFRVKDVVEHRARMREEEVAMRALYEEFDDTPGPGG